MNFKKNESEQKLRGGYYTPKDLALFITKWATADSASSCLEPSCGDGVFLECLAETAQSPIQTTGFEVDPHEASTARDRVKGKIVKIEICARDFLQWALQQLADCPSGFDAVVGNPPFIRYQYLPAAFQERSEQVFKSLCLGFTKHTNAWVPFVLASLRLLRSGGRLGMVLPAEIMHVAYAGSVRAYLAAQCSEITIIDPDRLWFPNTLQGAVILLAKKKTHPTASAPAQLRIVSVSDREFLHTDPDRVFESGNAVSFEELSGKWTLALLNRETRELMREVVSVPQVKRFDSVATVDVGIVTGANDFFLVRDSTVDRYRLHDFARPGFGRSEHCPGVVYDIQQHERNAAADKPTNFLWFQDSRVQQNETSKSYIALGEHHQYHTRYKCRIRDPWYRVPSVYATGIALLKRAHIAPRLVLNRINALTTDTAYRVTSKSAKPDVLVASFLNPLTALSAEVEGRQYGGGVLELVPSEIERLLLPVPKTVRLGVDLLDKLVRDQPLDHVIADHGWRVLKAVGLARGDFECLLSGWRELRNRRLRIATPSSAQPKS